MVSGLLVEGKAIRTEKPIQSQTRVVARMYRPGEMIGDEMPPNASPPLFPFRSYGVMVVAAGEIEWRDRRWVRAV